MGISCEVVDGSNFRLLMLRDLAAYSVRILWEEINSYGGITRIVPRKTAISSEEKKNSSEERTETSEEWNHKSEVFPISSLENIYSPRRYLIISTESDLPP